MLKHHKNNYNLGSESSIRDPWDHETPTVGERFRNWIKTPKGSVMFGTIAAVVLAFALLVAVPLLSAPTESSTTRSTTALPETATAVLVVRLDNELDQSSARMAEFVVTDYGNSMMNLVDFDDLDIPGYTYVSWSWYYFSDFGEEITLNTDEHGNPPQRVIVGQFYNNALYNGSVGNMELQVNFIDRATGNKLLPPYITRGHDYLDRISVMAQNMQGYMPETASVAAELHIYPDSDTPYLTELTIYYNPIPQSTAGPDAPDVGNAEGTTAA